MGLKKIRHLLSFQFPKPCLHQFISFITDFNQSPEKCLIISSIFYGLNINMLQHCFIDIRKSLSVLCIATSLKYTKYMSTPINDLSINNCISFREHICIHICVCICVSCMYACVCVSTTWVTLKIFSLASLRSHQVATFV